MDLRPAEDFPARPAGRLKRFFVSRWKGEAPLPRLFWRDMIAIGTLINLATTMAALAVLAAKAPLAVSLAVHFSALPYNMFLAFAVWRTAERVGGAAIFLYQAAALVWLIAATMI